MPVTPLRPGNGGNRTGPGFLGAFLGGSVRRVVAGVAGRRLLLCVLEEWSGSAGNSSPVDRHSQATGGSHQRTAQEDGEARRSNFPRPPGRAGASRRPPPTPSTPEADTTTTAARAARGDGRQPRWEHRHRWRPPAAPTHENKSGGQLPATSPTASAISFLPTVQQRGRVGHLQSPRHRTISWNGVSRERSAQFLDRTADSGEGADPG